MAGFGHDVGFNWWKIDGGSCEEDDRLNPIDRGGSRGGNRKTIPRIVGVSVYYETWCFVKYQKNELRRLGKIMAPPDLIGARKKARSPGHGIEA